MRTSVFVFFPSAGSKEFISQLYRPSVCYPLAAIYCICLRSPLTWYCPRAAFLSSSPPPPFPSRALSSLLIPSFLSRKQSEFFENLPSALSTDGIRSVATHQDRQSVALFGNHDGGPAVVLLDSDDGTLKWIWEVRT